VSYHTGDFVSTNDAIGLDSTIVECGYQEACSGNTIIWQVKIFRRGTVGAPNVVVFSAGSDEVSIPAYGS
jgi:hypothetical protein